MSRLFAHVIKGKFSGKGLQTFITELVYITQDSDLVAFVYDKVLVNLNGSVLILALFFTLGTKKNTMTYTVVRWYLAKHFF